MSNIDKYIKRHEKALREISPVARRVILFSSVSLFCTYGDMYIGTESVNTGMENANAGTENANAGTENANASITLFGIQIFGITQTKFLLLLLIMNIYLLIRFVFSVIKNIVIANSFSLFKDVIGIGNLDKYNEELNRIISEEMTSDLIGDMKSKDHADSEIDANRKDEELTNLEEKTENKREILLMMKHNILGLLEYFVAPIIFPAILSLWASIMLVIQVFC